MKEWPSRRRKEISTHAPARGATCRQRYVVVLYPYFNPRSRKGSDQYTVAAMAKGDFNFNPRSRKGSDCAEAPGDYRERRFQPTLPQGERRKWRYSAPGRHPISTHAPARGATGNPDHTLWQFHISTHAPARGATSFDSNIIFATVISTHAPARGATVNTPVIKSINP